MVAITNLGRATKNALLVFNYLESNPIIEIRKTAEALGIAFNTTSSAVNRLLMPVFWCKLLTTTEIVPLLTKLIWIFCAKKLEITANQNPRYKLRRKTHMLACGIKATFSLKNYIFTT